MKPESMDRVFFALAHAARRKMLDIVRSMPGCSVTDVCKYFDMSRIAVMKHLAILEEAQLIIPRKQGRVRELYMNVVPLQLIYDRWTTEYSSFWATQATDLKFLVESGSSLSLDHPAASRPGATPPTETPVIDDAPKASSKPSSRASGSRTKSQSKPTIQPRTKRSQRKKTP
ncbi:MAG: helix-turn-helix transcriptional regulator [Planctomycetales bacterium]|nr:helix-turn-helix transcriptional regulator [Planctomycetales bacterium]